MAKKATAKKTTTRKTTRKTAKPSASLKAAAKKTGGKKTTTKKAATKKSGQMSAIDAAAKVLGESKEPLNTKQMIEKMAAKKYWTSPGGKTPHATLYTVVTMLPCVAP